MQTRTRSGSRPTPNSLYRLLCNCSVMCDMFCLAFATAWRIILGMVASPPGPLLPSEANRSKTSRESSKVKSAPSLSSKSGPFAGSTSPAIVAHSCPRCSRRRSAQSSISGRSGLPFGASFLLAPAPVISRSLMRLQSVSGHGPLSGPIFARESSVAPASRRYRAGGGGQARGSVRTDRVRETLRQAGGQRGSPRERRLPPASQRPDTGSLSGFRRPLSLTARRLGRPHSCATSRTARQTTLSTVPLVRPSTRPARVCRWPWLGRRTPRRCIRNQLARRARLPLCDPLVGRAASKC